MVVSAVPDLPSQRRLSHTICFQPGELLTKLKTELLVLDWKKRQQTRAAVQVTIERLFDDGLPDVYDRSLFTRKCSAVFEHVFSAYDGAGKSVYAEVA